MKYCVDTDKIVEYLKGREPTVTLLNTLAEEGLALSVITFAEVYEGIYYGADPKRNERVFRRFLKFANVLPVTRAVALRFAVMRGALRQRGEIVPQPDLLIAATALHHNLILVTGNERHFRRIPGLQIR